jgi:chitinase
VRAQGDRIVNRYRRTLIALIFILCGAWGGEACAAVLFEDNFDTKPDWWPTQAVAGCEQAKCLAQVPPGWNYFRNTELWNPLDPAHPVPGSHPTLQISGANHRGPSGKALTVWHESNKGKGGDGWGADGILAKDLGKDYPEIYLQARIKFQPGFQWHWGNNAGMAKILRLYHWDRTFSPFNYHARGHCAPMSLVDFETGEWGFDALVSMRCAPQATNYFCKPVSYAHAKLESSSFPKTLGDDNWHTITLYGKLNSAPGVADGVSRFWVDGKLIYQNAGIAWLEAGSDRSIGWNIIAVGGNAFNSFGASSSQAEQWYALDDIVVSTAPIPMNYRIENAR